MQIQIQNSLLRPLIGVLFSADTDSDGSVLPLPTFGWPQHCSCLIQSRILRSSRLPVQNHTKYNKPSGGRSFRSLFSVVDPDPQRSGFGCPGYGSVLGMRIRIQEHGNLPKFTNIRFLFWLRFKKPFLPLYVSFLTHYLLLVYLACKILTVVTRIGICMVWLPGSGSALKSRMRIHNIAFLLFDPR